MQSNNSDQKQLEELYEGIFDGIRGAINSMKQGVIPWVGEEGNTETYLEYWRSFTKETLSLIDKYDRNANSIVGEIAAEKDSPAEVTYRKIMLLKEFLNNQAVSPWKYGRFNCADVQQKKNVVRPPSFEPAQKKADKPLVPKRSVEKLKQPVDVKNSIKKQKPK